MFSTVSAFFSKILQNRGSTPEILHTLIIPMDQIIIGNLGFKQNIDREHT